MAAWLQPKPKAQPAPEAPPPPPPPPQQQQQSPQQASADSDVVVLEELAESKEAESAAAGAAGSSSSSSSSSGAASAAAAAAQAPLPPKVRPPASATASSLAALFAGPSSAAGAGAGAPPAAEGLQYVTVARAPADLPPTFQTLAVGLEEIESACVELSCSRCPWERRLAARLQSDFLPAVRKAAKRLERKGRGSAAATKEVSALLQPWCGVAEAGGRRSARGGQRKSYAEENYEDE